MITGSRQGRNEVLAVKHKIQQALSGWTMSPQQTKAIDTSNNGSHGRRSSQSAALRTGADRPLRDSRRVRKGRVNVGSRRHGSDPRPSGGLGSGGGRDQGDDGARAAD